MRTKSNLIIAAIAAAALGLSACGGDTEPAETTPAAETTAVEETTAAEPTEAEPTEEEAPAEEPTEEEGPAEEPSGDFPYSDGDTVDPQEFTDRLTAALEGVDQMTINTTVDGVEASVTQVDNSDPANPRSYAVSTMGEQEMEIVVEGETSWTRIDGGEWTEAPVDPSLAGGTDLSQTTYSSVEVIDAAAKQFRVGIDMGGSAIEADLTVDDQFRPFLMAMDAGGMATVATYDYDSPVEIPEVA